MVQAAERAGVEHFVFFSALGASSHDRTRLLRAKALAERAVLASDVRHTVFAPSLVYAPGDRLLTLLERMAMVLPVDADQRSRRARCYQPIWAEDVADCVIGRARPRRDATAPGTSATSSPGPQTLSHREIVELVAARRRPRAAARQRADADRQPRAARRRDADEVARAGDVGRGRAARGLDDERRAATADAEALGVTPRAMAAVLGQRANAGLTECTSHHGLAVAGLAALLIATQRPRRLMRWGSDALARLGPRSACSAGAATA